MQPPHSFSVEIATQVGVEKAILLHNIVFRWQKDRAYDHNFHDGKWRVYNSSRAFSELFPYFKQESIKRRLKELVQDGYLAVGCYNKMKFDKTLRYSPASTVLLDYGISIVQKHTMDGEKMNNGEGENEPTIPVLNPIDNPVDNNSSKEEEANASIEEFGKSDINFFIKHLEQACTANGIIYVPAKKERWYAKNLLSKSFSEKIKQFDMTIFDFTSKIIALTTQKFVKQCNNCEKLYYNWGDVLNQTKNNQNNGTKVIVLS